MKDQATTILAAAGATLFGVGLHQIYAPLTWLWAGALALIVAILIARKPRAQSPTS